MHLGGHCLWTAQLVRCLCGHGSDWMSVVVSGVWVLILDLLVFEGNVVMLMGLSTAGSLHCMLLGSLIL